MYDSPWPSGLSVSAALATVSFMLVVMLVIVLGNLLVVLTVHNDGKLRSQRQNWLIVSLAIADLLVGLLVMPLTMSYEIIGEWRLGMVLCELWLALDVLFVTASILHICTISLDRYWSVTQPLYAAKRTPRRISIMIGVSWLLSLLICLPPILGWHPSRANGECTVSTNLGYVLYSALGSFYIPVILLIIVYSRIFVITKRHSRKRLAETARRDQTLSTLAGQAIAIHRVSLPHRQSLIVNKQNKKNPMDKKDNGMSPSTTDCSNGCCSMVENQLDQTEMADKRAYCRKLLEIESAWRSSGDRRRRLLKAKERQATFLLGLILSAFILSWLPFFAMYVLGAFGFNAPQFVFKFFFWLGYCNSGLNPIIYTVFNREFKRALCRQLRRIQSHFIRIKEQFL